MAKSPASRPLLEPLHEEDRRLGDEYRKKRKQYVLDLRDWKKKKAGDQTEMPEEPRRVRAVVTSVTYEGLAASLAASPRGVTVHSDEIAQLIRGFDAYQKVSGPARPFFLSLWSGEPYSEGRKTAIESEVENPFTVIFGTVQPSVLRRLHLLDGDGLCARFLWFFIRRAVHGLGQDLHPEMQALWRRILHLARTHRVTDVQCFEPDAIQLMDEQIMAWSAAAQELDAAGAGLKASMYGKAADHCARFVAVLHGMDAIELSLAESATQPPPLQPRAIPRTTVERALQVIDVLLQHAGHAADLVLRRDDPDADSVDQDGALASQLRSVVPAGVEVDAEPHEWASALSTDQRRWTAMGMGKAMARLARAHPDALVVSRPNRDDSRHWRVHHLRTVSEASVVSVPTRTSDVPVRSADTSVASVTSAAFPGAVLVPAGVEIPTSAPTDAAPALVDAADAIEAEMGRAIVANDEPAIRLAHRQLAALLQPNLADAVEIELRLEHAGHARGR